MAPALEERWAPLWKDPSSHYEILPRGEHKQKERGSSGERMADPQGTRPGKCPQRVRL